MGSRSRDTFKKRQKEVARAEKQQEKAARRLQRKAEKRALDANGGPPPEDIQSEDTSPGDEGPASEITVTS